jgi:KDO2-lipid IV(A) lauroyltransferase
LLTILKIFGKLPWWLLNFWSFTIFVFLYYIIGYRKKIVRDNLKKSFPEKSEYEIKNIEKKFYKNLCDIIFETLKIQSITKNDLSSKITISDSFSDVEKNLKQNQSVIIVIGHQGNWELIGAAFAAKIPTIIKSIYFPLKNTKTNQWLLNLRSKFGNEMYASNDVLRKMITNKNSITLNAFIADQTPSYDQCLWTTFLNQNTPFFMGPEKLAKKFNYPVFYAQTLKTKKNHYIVQFYKICDKPNETNDEFITKKYIQLLEKSIQEQPETWLWSHKRWKRKQFNN